MSTETKRAARRRQRQRRKARREAERVVHCDYCNEPAELVTGETLYPHRPDLAHIKAWQCLDCEAHVGCHDGTNQPKGRLANEGLRKAKMRAHAAFDPLWKSGDMGRKDAYRWLSQELEIDYSKAHIGMFDEEMCERVIEAVGMRVMVA